VRAAVIADVHGNIDALAAFETWLDAQRGGIDEVWVLGDLVDYGPAPIEVIQWVAAHATWTVRGNHDHAMATGEDCRSAPEFHAAAVATRNAWRSHLGSADVAFLAGLPLRTAFPVGDARVELVHATPMDPLFDYLPGGATEAAWARALEPLDARTRFLFVGHTHVGFVRRVGAVTVVNPGSLGMPKDGDPCSAFAVFDGEHIESCRVAYDVDRAIGRLRALRLPSACMVQLDHAFRRGR